MSSQPIGVRISAATPEADLSACVWPGVTTIFYPRVESREQVERADTLVSRLERQRGIRPRTVEIRPLIETPAGVSRAHGIASSSDRIHAFGLGPHVALGGEALAYARGECELVARSLELTPVDVERVLD